MRQRERIALAALAVPTLGIGYLIGRAASPDASLSAAPKTAAAAAHEGAAPQWPSTLRNSSRSTPAAPPGSPLPAPGTPLKQEAAELQARADAGDAEAASRLYRDTHTCAGVRYAKAVTAQFAPIALDRKFDGDTPEALQHADRMLERIQKQLDFVRDNSALCEGLSDEDLNTEFPRAFLAAQLGDSLAADCYLGTTWDDLLGLLDHPEWITQFKQNAPTLIDVSIARGDWDVVTQLVEATAPGHVGFRYLLPQLTGNDPVQHYRYLKLLSLGASTDDEVQHKRLADAADAISSEAVRDADAWAQDVYQRNFSGVPPYSGNMYRACHQAMASGYQ